MSEGTVHWRAGATWYWVSEGDDPAKVPLLILHGGPGAAAFYVEPIAALSRSTGRTCVVYDQLGCGRSEHLPDAPVDFWTPQLFLEELGSLLDHLGLGRRYNLLGQSWGGMLAMEHAVLAPAGLNALVVANSPASMPLWVREADRLRELLPDDVQETLTRHERAATTDDPEYTAAVAQFDARHVCRMSPTPEPYALSMANIEADPTVYHTMNGPSEFHVIGTLWDWDITPRLGAIDAPTLVISGEYDEATPAVVEPLVAAIPGAHWELMAGASHLAHLEQPERFAGLVADFLAARD